MFLHLLKTVEYHEKLVVINVAVRQCNRDLLHFFLSVGKTVSAELVETSFDNSIVNLVAAFTGGQKLSKKDAEEIRKLI